MKSISGLLPFESLVHGKSSCFTMLRWSRREKKEEKSVLCLDLFGEDGNKKDDDDDEKKEIN